MENKDRRTLIIFIILIILIVGMFLYNKIRVRKLDVDRKVEYIFNDYTYDNVLNNGNNLFFQTIELLTNKNVFLYEKDNNDHFKYYSINDYNQYKKIINFIVVTNTLKKSEVSKYMDLKKIIEYENDYYIENDNNSINSNYIGSMLEIDSYDNNYVYFKSNNYYCDNYSYVGELKEEPICDYDIKESYFKIVHENNNLRIDNLDEIKSIVN